MTAPCSSRIHRQLTRRWAAAGSALFFAVAPGVVAGLLPWWLTGWRFEAFPLPLRLVGALLTIGAGLVLVSAFARFVIEGIGTPAPVAPTRHLVVGGLYRYVRNPMYLAVVTTIVGQAVLFGQLGLLGERDFCSNSRRLQIWQQMAGIVAQWRSSCSSLGSWYRL